MTRIRQRVVTVGDTLCLCYGGALVEDVTDDRGRPLAGYTSSPVSGAPSDAAAAFERPLALAEGETRPRCRRRRASLGRCWLA